MGSGGYPPQQQQHHQHHQHNQYMAPPPSHHGGGGGGSIGFGGEETNSAYNRPPPPPHQQYQQPPRQYGNSAAPAYQQSPHQGGGGQQQQHYGGSAPPQHYHNQQQGGGFYQQGGSGGGLRAATNTVWLGGPGANNLMDGHLFRVFGDFGKVMRVSRLKDKNVIFVHFRTTDEAQEAVRKLQLDPSPLEGNDVRLNYGKMFEYTPEEMAAPYDPAVDNSKEARLGMRRDRDDFGGNNFGGGQRGGRFEPTNVLYIGDVPNSVTTEEIKNHLASFPVREVSRNEFKGVVFVHFDTTEQCTHCLDVMRDAPLGGFRVKMNYGTARPALPPREDGGAPGGANRSFQHDDGAVNLDREQPTNVVFLGALPMSTSLDEIEELFRRFTGYMNCKYLQDKALCFGHFDSVENAIACRLALQGCLVQGQPVRVNFGKTNHNLPVGNNGGFSDLLDDRSHNNQLTLHNGGSSDAPLNLLPTQSAAEMAASVQAYLRQARPAPTANNPNSIPSMQDRIRTLMAMTYNSCGEVDKALSPAAVQNLCAVVDSVVDEETARAIDTTVEPFLPSQGTHVAATIARRLKSNFDDDNNKKLLVLYATMRAFFKADTSVVYLSKACIDMILVVVAVAADGQTDSAAFDGIDEVLNGFRAKYLTSGAPNCKYDETYLNNAGVLIKEIEEKMSVDKDLASLIQRKR